MCRLAAELLQQAERNKDLARRARRDALQRDTARDKARLLRHAQSSTNWLPNWCCEQTSCRVYEAVSFGNFPVSPSASSSEQAEIAAG